MIKGYTFNLGGAEWTIDMAGDIAARWNFHVGSSSITLATKMLGEELREDIIKKHMWNAIYDIIHNKIMFRKGKKWDRHVLGMMNGVASMMVNLPYVMPTEKSSRYMTILGTNYEVRVENIICQQDKIYGRCNPNNFVIIIQDQERDIKYHPQFVRQTLIHECIHAVNYEMGLQHTVWDEEDQVNPLSYHLAEVWHTLQPIKTTDDATDTKNTQTQ